ncbi:sensor histidine kinase [Sphaerisporangium fuscum]|uniref:sensor histidine kinase n=1 Tax=Sphaerisporangium fuscum TaxID=2835868 RepID=UPI001BDC9B4C|nr:HAMP domain-containing sensor histidine kinase [Sphaerisporangium fuscum]
MTVTKGRAEPDHSPRTSRFAALRPLVAVLTRAAGRVRTVAGRARALKRGAGAPNRRGGLSLWRAGLRLRLVAGFVVVAVLSSAAASCIAYFLIQRSMIDRTQANVIGEFKNTLGRSVPADMEAWSSGFSSPGISYLQQLKSALSVQGRYDVKLAQVRDGNIFFFPDFDTRYGVDLPGDFVQMARGNTVYRRIDHRGTPFLLVGGQVYGERRADGTYRPTPIMGFVIVSLAREADDLRTLARVLVIANVATVVVAVVFALVAARGVLGPVRRLGRAAHDLGEGRLDTRVEVLGRDELADLARTFNRTAGALEGTVAELRAMEESSRRFVADVSHELRTPLTAITALTDTLADKDVSAADRETAGPLVTEGIRRLGTLVEHLIEISRLDSGTAALVPDDLNVGEAVAACLAPRGWAGRVEIDGPPDLMARIDPRRFDVIMANLVGNALKHGAPPVVVRFRQEANGDVPGVTLTVTDHGPGIPRWLLPLVFDRFVKLDRARASSEGSGLGLAIARANVELHGGVVNVVNDEPRGAVFTVWLPLGEDA